MPIFSMPISVTWMDRHTSRLRTLIPTLWLLATLTLTVYGREGGGEDDARFTVLTGRYQSRGATDCLHLTFTYHTVSELLGGGETITGEIWYDRERFRLAAAGNLYLCDSLAFYQVYPANRQLLIERIDRREEAAHPAGLLGRLEDSFQLLAVEEQSTATRWQLAPRREGWLTQAWLQTAGERLTLLELTDINGTLTVIQLTAEERLSAIPDTLFQLPAQTADYEIIDLRGTSHLRGTSPSRGTAP